MNALAILPLNSVASSQVVVHSTGAPEFIDITDEVVERVRALDLWTGLAVVTSQHTTASVIINEHEPELLKDLTRLLNEAAAPEREYAHNFAPCGPDEAPNGHSHCQALMLGSSVTVPIVAGHLALGRWQRIFLVELDHARRRVVTVTLVGTSEHST